MKDKGKGYYFQFFPMLTLWIDLKTGGHEISYLYTRCTKIFIAAQLSILRHLGIFFEFLLYEFPIFNIGYGRQQAMRLTR
jgi:hypothetical protein